MESNLSRKDFLKASMLAGMGVLGAGSLAACAPQGESASGAGAANAEGVAWDQEVDVLVVGSGTGTMAAAAAKDAGAENVLILEKSEFWGGTSATSGGGFYVPMNYVAKEQGVEDNREDAVKYIMACSDGRAERKLVETYVDNANQFLEWARDTFKWTWGFTSGTMFQDYYEPYEGYRAFGRGSVSMVDEDRTQTPWGKLQGIVKDMGIEVQMKTAAERLVTDADGAVVGVVTDGGKYIHAKTCVVLATGGFDHNPDMVKQNLPFPIYVTDAAAGNTGDGQALGAEIGAHLAYMDGSWGVPCYLPGPFDPTQEMKQDIAGNDWGLYRGCPNSIIVNKYGKRFANESMAYAPFNRTFGQWDSGKLEYANIPAFFICDSEFTTYYALPGQKKPGDPLPEMVVQADTLEELAGKLGIDPAGLVTEVEAFNVEAEAGTDSKFHRGERAYDAAIPELMSGGARTLANIALGPVAKGPFYGILCLPGMCGTNGGLHTNEHAQVLKPNGDPIPGLLAVGNCAASIFGGAYAGGGTTLGSGSVMGWLGVRHALGK